MALNLNTLKIILDGTGSEIPILSVSDSVEKYYIVGAATATGNYSINPTGSPQQGTTFLFKYKAVLVLGSYTFSIFGQSITANQLLSDLDIECYYDGSAWMVEVKPSFTSVVIETANILNSAITTPKVNNDAITNDKLDTMTTASVKYGNASGDPGDLALAANEVPMGNGTTVVATNISSLSSGVGQKLSMVIPVCFDSPSGYVYHRTWVEFDGDIDAAKISVTEAIVGNAELSIRINGVPLNNGTISIPSGTALNYEQTINPNGVFNSFTAGSYIDFRANTSTVGGGGEALVTLLITRT